MIQVFLAPVSGATLFTNYKKTVETGFDPKDFFSFKQTSQYRNILTGEDKIRLWGVKDLKIAAYRQCKINDYLLFYFQGKIISAAKIFSLDKNRDLSNFLWGKHRNLLKNNVEYWDNLLFLDSFIKVDIDFKVLINFARYQEKASVRGFNKYRTEGVIKILQDFGSIEEFLKRN